MSKKKDRNIQMLNYIEQAGEIDVIRLSEIFNISKETARRDLNELANQGLIIRTHGGAQINKSKKNDSFEYPFYMRQVIMSDEKKALCKYAASLIEDNDAIFIDNSSTTSFILENINPSLHVTIITNSFNLLAKASQMHNSNVEIISLGGILNTSTSSNYSFTGMITTRNAQDFYPNKAFYSCAGVRQDGVMTDIGTVENEIKRVMLKRTVKNYFLIDHTKLHSDGQVYVTSLDDNKFDILIDGNLSREDRAVVSQWKTKVLVVNC